MSVRARLNLGQVIKAKINAIALQISDQQLALAYHQPKKRARARSALDEAAASTHWKCRQPLLEASRTSREVVVVGRVTVSGSD